MSQEDDKSPKSEPVYPAGLHSDVVGECREWLAKGRPWTRLRVLQRGVDASEVASCDGSQGHFSPCPKKVEAVQYTTAFGDPQWYCEEHALKQADWDTIFYDSKPEPQRPPRTAEDEEWLRRFMAKGKKKQERVEEVEP